MNSQSVFILGAGHLAHRVRRLVENKGYQTYHVKHLPRNPAGNYFSSLDSIREVLSDYSPDTACMTYVLYEEDEDNLEMIIALMSLYPSLKMCTSLFNENIRPDLEAANPELRIINPARIAAPAFVAALDAPLEKQKKATQPLVPFPAQLKSREDKLIIRLIIVFAAIVVLAIIYFHFAEGLSLIDAAYFVVVTIATVGYGDINLKESGVVSKLAGIMLMLSSVILIWMIFSLVIDRMIKQRVQHALGRKRYRYKDHIILCGLGRLGYFIAEKLLERGEKVVIIENSESNPNIEYFRGQGLDVYSGNARNPKVLQDAGAAQCRAVISVLNNDFGNLEIALNARHFQADIQLILRVFDGSMSKVINEKFGVDLTLSMSQIADEHFAALLPDYNDLH